MEKIDVEQVSFAGGDEAPPAEIVEGFKERAGANTGFILTIDGDASSSLRLAKDGKTVLHPQPANDDRDPLNWPTWKKHTILMTISWGAFCADFTAAAGSATVVSQAAEWNKSLGRLNETNSINVLMMALGGILWVPLCSVIGRAPTLFWSSFFGLLAAIGTVLSPDYETYYAMRALMGFFITSSQTISIAFIYDMFFFHERARKIGLWALLYIGSPLWGPLVGNFVMGATDDWKIVFWVCAAVCALYMALIVAFLDETWYNRNIPTPDQPTRGRSFISRLSRVVGIWQLRHHRFYYKSALESYRKFALTFFKPTLFIMLVAYMIIFAWAIGINISAAILFATPSQFGGYGYSHYTVGYLYFAPLVGLVFGEVFGHFFNDYLLHRYSRRHNGIFQPEARLPMVYISCVPMMAGLILLGQALSRRLPITSVIFGWGLHNFGIMTTSVVVSAYAIDCHPEAAAEVSGWVNFARAIGGFSVAYFQQPWGAKVGYDGSFRTQAGIVAFGGILVGFVHYFGSYLRLKAGPVC